MKVRKAVIPATGLEKEALKKQELFKVIENSSKSYEEIYDFLMSDGKGE